MAKAQDNNRCKRHCINSLKANFKNSGGFRSNNYIRKNLMVSNIKAKNLR